MKEIFVDQIKEREPIVTVFLVREKTVAMAKNGKPYMTLKLMDRTGEVEGRIWDNVERLDHMFSKNDFIKVGGKASVYMGKLQLVIQQLERLDENNVDLADFVPVSKRPLATMRAELDALLDSLTDPYIEALLRSFFDDPEFFQKYSKAPAAKGMHHVYLGGLLEHSLAVAALGCDVAQRYPKVNRDLLISGALLHDIGKVVELAYNRSFDYTDEGKLLGHIIIGVQMIEDRVRSIAGFPEELSMMVKHLLLSHHGQYEYGSPKRPKFLEAVILNFIDDLDSKINGVLSHIEKEPDNSANWTGYHRLYDRYFYKAGMADEATEEAPVFAPERPASVQANQPKNDTKKKKSFSKPLGATLGEQLKEKNLDLFASMTRKEDGK